VGHWHEHQGHGHGHGHGRGHGFGGCRGGGPWGGFPGRYNREEWVRRLEEHQKDLEQRVADVADLIRRLKEDQPQQASSTSMV
jgi:hypothetical protein